MAIGARALLYDWAVGQYGFVTSRDAVELGIDRNRLYRMSHWSGLTRVAHGVYRFDGVPPTSKDEYMEVVLRVGRDAFLQGESVLALHSLALVNPRVIHVGVPRRVRRRLPANIELQERYLPAEHLTRYDGILCTTVSQALLDCVPHLMKERLGDATQRALDEGLITQPQAEHITAAVAVG